MSDIISIRYIIYVIIFYFFFLLTIFYRKKSNKNIFVFYIFMSIIVLLIFIFNFNNRVFTKYNIKYHYDYIYSNYGMILIENDRDICRGNNSENTSSYILDPDNNTIYDCNIIVTEKGLKVYYNSGDDMIDLDSITLNRYKKY